MAFSCVSCLHALLFPLVLRLMCFPFFKRNRLWTTVICWVLIKTDPQPAYKKKKKSSVMLFLITKLHGKIKTDNGFGIKYEVQKFARAVVT